MENLNLNADEAPDFFGKNFYISKKLRTNFIEEIEKLAGGKTKKSNSYLLALN